MKKDSETQLSLDFESKVSLKASQASGPSLKLVHSVDVPKTTKEVSQTSKIIETIVSHARSLSW